MIKSGSPDDEEGEKPAKDSSRDCLSRSLSEILAIQFMSDEISVEKSNFEADSRALKSSLFRVLEVSAKKPYNMTYV